jgi:murein DD-endopeptidase MepM/ murein hydrolase activator NlpD
MMGMLAGCDFEPDVSPIDWQEAGPQPLQDGLEEQPQAPVPPPVEQEAPPPPEFESVPMAECLDFAGRTYCVGQTFVTSGGLNLRDGGSQAAAILAVLPCGATVTIQALPQAGVGSEHAWASVVTDGGAQGWVAVDVLDETVPTCSLPSMGERYPGAGEGVLLSDLPFEADIYSLEYWWGFGNTTFAQDNVCLWYENTSGLHPGLDFALPYNTTLSWTGTERGQVVGINGRGESYGAGPYSVVIESGGFHFIYGHMSDDPPNLELDQWVEPGQLIGTSGNPDGREDAGNDHLHLEIRPADDRRIAINPLYFMGQEQQVELDEYFAGDYSGEDSPMSLGYYTLSRVPECFED